MALPKAVEEASRRADEFYAKQAGTQQAPAQVEQKAPEPEVKAPEKPEEIGRPAIPDAPESKDYQQMYRVLQGKYNHEVPRLQSELKQLRGELTAAMEEIGKLKSQPKPEAPSPAVPTGIKPEELEQYGPEFIDMMRRVARSEVPQPVKTDTSNLEQRVQTAEEVARVAVQRQFFADLTKAVPDWEQKNTDDGFLRWLDEVDPMTGSPRQSVFDDAYARLDVNRVAAFFKAYGGNVGAAPSGMPPSMATPSTMRGQTDVPQGKKIWRQKEIAEFYSNLRGGLITAEDAARTETEIFAAQNEGRIR